VAFQDRRRSLSPAFAPRTLLCVSTDRLAERRDQPLDESIANLCAAVSAVDPEVACAAVMAAMTGEIPHADARPGALLAPAGRIASRLDGRNDPGPPAAVRTGCADAT
jgi:hypothetical protein